MKFEDYITLILQTFTSFMCIFIKWESYKKIELQCANVDL